MDTAAPRRAAVLAGLALTLSVPAAHADGERAGTVLSWALPAGVAAYTLMADRPGALPFGEAFVASQLATEVLKRTTHVERPNGQDDRAFPSGHAARAFSAATFVHRRYGAENAWPLYLAATWVGYTRVDADQHRWRDVAGGAAVSAAMTWWLVEPKGDGRVAVFPAVGPGGASVTLQARW